MQFFCYTCLYVCDFTSVLMLKTLIILPVIGKPMIHKCSKLLMWIIRCWYMNGSISCNKCTNNRRGFNAFLHWQFQETSERENIFGLLTYLTSGTLKTADIWYKLCFFFTFTGTFFQFHRRKILGFKIGPKNYSGNIFNNLWAPQLTQIRETWSSLQLVRYIV